MKYRRLDSVGDYVFGFGATCFLTDLQAVSQAINTKLKLFQGDFWGGVNDGLPFFQEIAGQSNESKTDLLIQSRIKEVPNVTGISSFSSSVDSKRKYTATIGVNTSYGTVEVTV